MLNEYDAEEYAEFTSRVWNQRLGRNEAGLDLTDVMSANEIERLDQNHVAKATVYDRGPDEPARCAPVAFQDHHRFRGPHLKDLSRREYFALIRIVPMKRKPTTTKRGRRPNGFYSFDIGHPLHVSHCQSIKSRHDLVIDSGKRTAHPGPPPKSTRPSCSSCNGSLLSASGYCSSCNGNFLSSVKEHQVKSDAKYNAWKRKADAFAMYYLVMFRPETALHSKQQLDNCSFLSYTWEALCQWLDELNCTRDKAVSRMRLKAFSNAVFGTYCRNTDRLMMSAYRSRNRTIWDEEEKAAASDFFAHTGRSSKQELHQDYDNLAHVMNDRAVLELSGAEQARCMQELRYCSNLKTTLDLTYSDGCLRHCNSPSQPLPLHHPPSNKRSAPCRIMAPEASTAYYKNLSQCDYAMVGAKMAELAAAKHAADNGESSEAAHSSVSPHHVATNSASTCTRATYDQLRPLSGPEITAKLNNPAYKWGVEQRNIVDHVRDYLEQLGPHFARTTPPPKNPLQLLVTGMPGTGKSFVIERICDLALWLQSGHVATTSYNGIAAVNIDGITLCSLFFLNPPRRQGSSDTDSDPTSEEYPLPAMTKEKIAELRQKLQIDTLTLLIVDEVSNLRCGHIAAIDMRLRELTGREEPFGGIAVIFFGDFSQMGPCGGGLIPATLINLARLKRDQSSSQALDKTPSLSTSASTPTVLDAETSDGTSNGTLAPNHDATSQTCSALEENLCPNSGSVEGSARNSDVGGSGRHRKRKWQRIQNQTQKCLRPLSTNKKKKKRVSQSGTLAVGTRKRRGAELFASLQRYHIVKQQRIKNIEKDPAHNLFMRKLSLGQPIAYDDLCKYDDITAEDIIKDPEWKYAPILVATNREKVDIDQSKLSLFANDKGTYIFRWKRPNRLWRNMPLLPHEIDEVEDADPSFWQYFVAGAELQSNCIPCLSLRRST